MLVFLKLKQVCDRENEGGVFLWIVSVIRVSVTASYIMGKCQTDVVVSVFCDVKESMEVTV